MMRNIVLSLVAVAAMACSSRSLHAELAYSFEGGTDGFGANGGGVTVAASTTGVTEGTGSLSVSVVGGATFVGALTGNVPAPINDPPGLQSIYFDLTIVDAYAGAFADIGVTIFGATQPGPGQLFGLPSQFADIESLGGKGPGTYTVQIDLASATHPTTFVTGQSFNDIFGPNPGAPNDIIPTGFQFFISKSNDAPVTFYIDNVRTALVPEPATAALLSLSGLALVGLRRKR